MNQKITFVLAVAALTGACGGGADSPGSSNPLAIALCDKVAACEGQPLSASDRQMCLRLVSMAFSVPPDPESTIACLTNTSCADLMADPETITLACLDIDASSYQCTGDSLHLCTNQGVCTDVDCRMLCADWGYSYDSCGLSPSEGFDQCLCRI